MKRYEAYKPSGIEWLGDIPEHWDVDRIKDYTYLKARIGWQGLRSDEFIDNSNWYCLTGTDFSDGKINWMNCYCVDEERYKQDKKIQLKIGDLLITKDGTIGKIALIDYLPKPTTLNSGVFVSRPLLKKYINPFMYWVLSSNVFLSFIDLNKNGTTILHLYQNVFERFYYSTPPLSEQTAIANYLDTKTTVINRKIELLTAKADKYKALRRSLINETVCRGLNPNAPLKDSGIEWIGMIPEHWEVKRMKDIGFLFSGLSGKAGDDFNQDENENNRDFIPFTNIFNNDTINPNVMGKVVLFENEKQNRVKKDDLFFLMSSEDYDGLGKSSLLTDDLKETYLNSFCKGFRITKKEVFPAFLNYQLQSDTFRKVMQIEGKGFTRLNLKSEKITHFNVFIPNTIDEQKTIVDYLNKKSTQIDTILTNIGEQINKLTQLRKTLINDVVTGKIKVTD